nr:alkaline phosphatase D family protein [Deltaproteobacteria bacterium]
MITRRDLLAGAGSSLLASAALAGCGGPSPTIPLDDAATPADDASDGATFSEAVDFLHGVASGDPLHDRVILWTRVTPRPGPSAPVAVRWEVSTGLDFAALAASGSVIATSARDYTVKVDAEGLRPGVTYYYRFVVGDLRSPVGRARTAQEGALDRLRLAVVSCASLAQGYFHVYREIAERLDLDAVVHLGDYIYEHASGAYGNVRPYDPPTTLRSLSDYRRRYAQYRRDPDVRALHQQHAVIAVWDDHEFANNAWEGGAEGHMPRNDGPWVDRRDAAVRAYFEWMPLREQPDGRIWRRFAFGDLADLVMLDTRLWARPRQEPPDSPGLHDPRRSLLGDEQEGWLFGAVTSSRARWKIVGQQIRMSPLWLKFNVDDWEDYPAARNRLLQTLATMRVNDVAILTGDIHSSWAMDVATDPFDPAVYDPATGRGSIAVELIVPGVSSPGHPPEVEAQLPEILRLNPHLRFCNPSKRGYYLLDGTPERLQCEWYLLPFGSVERRERRATVFSAAWLTRRGDNHLTEGVGPSAPRDGAPPPAPWEPA